MADLVWFSDARLDRIRPLAQTDRPDKSRLDHRRVLSGIVRAWSHGDRWGDRADQYGSGKALDDRPVRRSERPCPQ